MTSEFSRPFQQVEVASFGCVDAGPCYPNIDRSRVPAMLDWIVTVVEEQITEPQHDRSLLHDGLVKDHVTGRLGGAGTLPVHQQGHVRGASVIGKIGHGPHDGYAQVGKFFVLCTTTRQIGDPIARPHGIVAVIGRPGALETWDIVRLYGRRFILVQALKEAASMDLLPYVLTNDLAGGSRKYFNTTIKVGCFRRLCLQRYLNQQRLLSC
jgi:hypothetical protein